jgi:hypothetical protein
VTAAPLVIAFEGDVMEQRHRDTFTADANQVFGALEYVRTEASIPSTRVDVIVASDFTAAVRAHMRDGEGLFDAERPFGRASAKNLAQDAAGEHVVIVFDARPLTMHPDGYDRFHALGTIAHELAHPILERARHESGVLSGVVRPSHTPGEISRSLGRIGVDEYRADAICDIVLAQVSSKTVDGVVSPAVTWDRDGQGWFNTVRDLFATLHPKLPDVIQTYREWGMDLETMWREVVMQSEAIVTAFMHARAHADQADAPVAILDAPEIRDLPFVQLFLHDTLPPYLETARDGPIVPPLADFAALDARIVSASETMLREIWRRLGLTFTENPQTRQFSIHVTEPLR